MTSKKTTEANVSGAPNSDQAPNVIAVEELKIINATPVTFATAVAYLNANNDIIDGKERMFVFNITEHVRAMLVEAVRECVCAENGDFPFPLQRITWPANALNKLSLNIPSVFNPESKTFSTKSKYLHIADLEDMWGTFVEEFIRDKKNFPEINDSSVKQRYTIEMKSMFRTGVKGGLQYVEIVMFRR